MKVPILDGRFLDALNFQYGVDGYNRTVKQDAGQSLNNKQYVSVMFGESKTKQIFCNVTVYALTFCLSCVARDASVFAAMTQALKKYAAAILQKKQKIQEKINEYQRQISQIDKMNDDLMMFISDVSAQKEKFKDKI
jgi:hypothetical protein